MRLETLQDVMDMSGRRDSLDDDDRAALENVPAWMLHFGSIAEEETAGTTTESPSASPPKKRAAAAAVVGGGLSCTKKAKVAKKSSKAKEVKKDYTVSWNG